MTDLLSLPDEVLLMVLGLVGRNDKRSCSLVCWALRHVTTEALFADVYSRWEDIDRLTNDMSHLLSCINTLHIVEASSWGEWHNGTVLSKSVNLCPKMTKLDIVLSSTSSWMKYLGEGDRSRVGTISLTSKIAMERRKFADNGDLQLPLFDFGDLVRAFPRVKKLKLEGFNVRFDDDNEATSIEDLELINCGWDFPFDMNIGAQLKALQLKYSRNFSSLTHLERVKTLSTSPPPSLTKLSLDFELGHMQKSWHPLADSCPQNLQELRMAGFVPPSGDFFKLLPSSVRSLALSIITWNPSLEEDLSKHCPSGIDLWVDTRLEKPPIMPHDLKT